MSACIEIQKLLPISPGDVPPEEYRRVTEHLQSCPVCSTLQEQLQALDEATAEIGVPDPGDEYWGNFSARVRQRAITEETTPAPVRRFIFRPAFGWPAAAAALLLVFFIGRAMIPDGEVPTVQPVISQTEMAPGAEEPLGPGMELQPLGAEIVTIESRSEPGGNARVNDEAAAESAPAEEQFADTSPESTTEETSPETSEPSGVAEPDASESYAAAEGKMPETAAKAGDETADDDLPLRRTIILQGDTVATQLSDQGLPSDKELASIERPNVPLPLGDTLSSSEAERVIAAPGSQDYLDVGGEPKMLNRSKFTEEDRIIFEKRIAELTRDVDEKKGGGREKACRELVDMFYQLAVNWRVQSDVRRAVEFMNEARDILPEDDHRDLESKAAALRSLLDE